MKYLFYIIFLGYCMLVTSCNGSVRDNKKPVNIDSATANPVKIDTEAVKNVANGSGREDSAKLIVLTDSIFKLPEVQRIHKQILAATANKHGVSLIPNLDGSRPGEYRVMVGYNGEERFENRMTFIANVNTMDIKVEDVKSGEDISISEYTKLHPLKN